MVLKLCSFFKFVAKFLIFSLIVCLCLMLYFVLVPYGLTFDSSPTIYFQTMCSLFYFSYILYIILVSSLLFYLLPNVLMFTFANHSAHSINFSTLNLFEISKFLYTFPVLILLYHSVWISPSVTMWFGHLVLTSFQFKVFYLVSFIFLTYLFALFTAVHISAFSIYDYLIVVFHLWFWLWVLFFSNNFFSLIFFIELLSISIMLLLITTVFTSVHFYNLTSYSNHSYFQHSHPSVFLQTLLIFFWMTLVSSLLLFFFLILFYLLVLSFDFNLVSFLFIFLATSMELTSFVSMSCIWFLFVLCVFVKGGIVPFFIWKPSFFKGVSFISLFLYIYLYYFVLFIYLVYCIICLMNELLLLYIYLLIGLISLGSIVISGMLFESFYIKAFLAISSILNSLIIFFAIIGLCSSTSVFILL